MTLTQFLESHDLDSTLLLGFYGGGNYGDELLMEVLAGLIKQKGSKAVSIAFQHPETYKIFHHDFGYPRVDPLDKKALLQTIWRKQHIIVGGGGLWGMDANFNILVMSLLLFCSRWMLGKKIYLLAVGYYDSATRLGRIGAWFAAKAAAAIIARDEETFRNFKRLNSHTSQDVDIAWYIDKLQLAPYSTDVTKLEKRLAVRGKTLFITVRHFRGSSQSRMAKIISHSLSRNLGKPIIIALLEPEHIDPEGYRQLEAWQQAYPEIQIIDFAFNPLALFLFFRKHHDNLVFIGPQFHAILSAHLTGVPYLPLAYDNKVQNLLRTIAPNTPSLSVQSLQALDVQRFINQAYGSAA